MNSLDRPVEIRAHPHPRCPLCGAAGRSLYEGLVDRVFGAPGRWGYRRCSAAGCGLTWLDPVPLEEDLLLAYHTYFTHGDDQAGRRAVRRRLRLPGVWAASAILWRLTPLAGARRRADLMFLADAKGGRLLEVGCGNGDRLTTLRDAGWEVEGQEVDPVAAELGRRRAGLTIHLGRLSDLALPVARYDAIVAHHVLEHVHDPVALLTECRRLLRPGGMLVAVTPNAASWGHARFRESWFYLDPPRHLHLFDPVTLATIARRAGFTPTIWTTAIHAQTVAAASFELRWRGSHVPGGGGQPGRDLAAVLFQAAAALRGLIVVSSGEECVLRAVGPFPPHPGSARLTGTKTRSR